MITVVQSTVQTQPDIPNNEKENALQKRANKSERQTNSRAFWRRSKQLTRLVRSLWTHRQTSAPAGILLLDCCSVQLPLPTPPKRAFLIFLFVDHQSKEERK